MILYHFTAREHLNAIKAEGLSRGEVPLSMQDVIQGVWFTTDIDSAGHGLSSGGALSAETLKVFERINGHPAPPGARFANKRAVRITAKILTTDRNLVHWPKWGRKRLEPRWYDVLNQAGGGKHKTWYVYFGTVPPSAFVAIDFLDGQPADMADVANSVAA